MYGSAFAASKLQRVMTVPQFILSGGSSSSNSSSGKAAGSEGSEPAGPTSARNADKLSDDIHKMMEKLRKENNQLRLENSQLFKELDIINRKVKSKLLGRSAAILESLMESSDVAYTINSSLSYAIPLSVFMEKFYRMYPESQSRLEVYERRGRQCSFVVPRTDQSLEAEGTAGYQRMIRGWMHSQRRNESAISDDSTQDADHIPTTVTKQFARDVPSLIRINGKAVLGSTDNQKVVAAFRAIREATGGNEMLTQQVMEIANQNLGILLYEDLVNHYSESGFLVKQTWYHYIDITLPVTKDPKSNQPPEGGEIVIYMLAIFELQSSDYENNPPLFVKAMLEITLFLSEPEGWSRESSPTISPTTSPAASPTVRRESRTMSSSSPMSHYVLSTSSGTVETRTRKVYSSGRREPMVRAVFSTPTFNILPFLHSVDFDEQEESSPRS